MLLGDLAVSGVAHEHVGGQTVRERADFTGRTAGRGLTGEREGAVARATLLGRQKMQSVDLFVDPHAAHVLIGAHAPEREDVALGVAIDVGELDELFLEAFDRLVGVTLGQVGHKVQGIGFQTLLVVFEADVPVAAGGRHLLLLDFGAGLTALADGFGLRQDDLLLLGLRILFGLKGELVGRTHAVADVHGARGKDAVILHELAVVGLAADDFTRQVIEDGQVRVGLEDDFKVGHARREVRVRGEVDDARGLVRELAVGDAAPEHGVRFGHVVAPEHHGVALFDVVIDVHRFVHTEGLVKAHHGRGHAKTRVGVDVVGAETGLEKLGGRVGFGNRVLARADDGHAFGALGLVDASELTFHFVERRLPAHGHELAVLVELAVLHTHQRLREAVLSVENLGVEVALDAVQTAVDGRVGIALGGDDAPVHGADLQTAARTAEAAHTLVPGNARVNALGSLGAGLRDGKSHRHGGRGGNAGLDEIAS